MVTFFKLGRLISNQDETCPLPGIIREGRFYRQKDFLGNLDRFIVDREGKQASKYNNCLKILF